MANPSARSPQPQHQLQSPLVHIKTAARKLPVKRKTPDTNPNPNPNPNSDSTAISIKTEDPSAASSSAFDVDVHDGERAVTANVYGGEEDEDDDDEEMEGDEGEGDGGGAAAAAPPFKFQRIWSESDEIRFLQGLLACHSQGFTFPRDLNLYYDRFSEAMSQPYTRSQLSEKLRRLRKKFRVHSARIARGVDPSALSPHDRDLFHLSTLLWDPSFAASSPFTSLNGSVTGNKRRRPHNNAVGGNGRARSVSLSTHPPTALLTPPASSSPPSAPTDNNNDGGSGGCQVEDHLSQQKKGFVSSNPGLGHLAVKTALDVFDSCLKEMRTSLVRRGLLYLDETPGINSVNDLEKRWRGQRVAELDVLARRMRLVLEQSIQK